MFDFFNKVSDFFESVTVNASSFTDFIKRILVLFQDSANWIFDLFKELPASVAWVAPIFVAFLIFDFVRGR